MFSFAIEGGANASKLLGRLVLISFRIVQMEDVQIEVLSDVTVGPYMSCIIRDDNC